MDERKAGKEIKCMISLRHDCIVFLQGCNQNFARSAGEGGGGRNFDLSTFSAQS